MCSQSNHGSITAFRILARFTHPGILRKASAMAYSITITSAAKCGVLFHKGAIPTIGQARKVSKAALVANAGNRPERIILKHDDELLISCHVDVAAHYKLC